MWAPLLIDVTRRHGHLCRFRQLTWEHTNAHEHACARTHAHTKIHAQDAARWLSSRNLSTSPPLCRPHRPRKVLWKAHHAASLGLRAWQTRGRDVTTEGALWRNHHQRPQGICRRSPAHCWFPEYRGREGGREGGVRRARIEYMAGRDAVRLRREGIQKV